MSRSGDLPAQERAATGIEGLDEVLEGGLTRSRIYLVQGSPGSGKTTLALQFLLQGAARGENTLYLTLSETTDELNAVADSHGWSLDGVEIHELESARGMMEPEQEYTVFHPAEVELGETIRMIWGLVESLQPARVAIDSLSELRLIALNPLRYRRQILALKQFFKGRNCTVLLLDDAGEGSPDMHLASIAHGVIALDHRAGDYGPVRRRLIVEKMRGQSYAEGYHDFAIRHGGIRVYPRLVAQDAARAKRGETLASGIEELDALTGGGLEMGSSVLFLGPSGAGKSVLATQYTLAAVQRGLRAAAYLFEESVDGFLNRAHLLSLDLDEEVDDRHLTIERVVPAMLSADEFTSRVRRAVEEDGARVVLIDSMTALFSSMPNDAALLMRTHELLTYLSQKGVLTLLTLAQHGLVGGSEAPVDVSYLADTVILLRYFEAGGSVRQALAVIKKRNGIHERTIRELHVGPGGVRVGPPLRGFEGVLSGAPQYRGTERLFELEREGSQRE
jgi:circadian clock protein KaiC